MYLYLSTLTLQFCGLRVISKRYSLNALSAVFLLLDTLLATVLLKLRRMFRTTFLYCYTQIIGHLRNKEEFGFDIRK